MIPLTNSDVGHYSRHLLGMLDKKGYAYWHNPLKRLVGTTGIEPGTPRV